MVEVLLQGRVRRAAPCRAPACPPAPAPTCHRHPPPPTTTHHHPPPLTTTTCSSVAFYISIYAVGFLASNLHTLAGGLPVFIYLCYMAILILGFFFAMGTIGCAASFWFVYVIFKAVKQD